jgi:hypothetical protein
VTKSFGNAIEVAIAYPQSVISLHDLMPAAALSQLEQLGLIHTQPAGARVQGVNSASLAVLVVPSWHLMIIQTRFLSINSCRRLVY